jgi:hypothetical protein
MLAINEQIDAAVKASLLKAAKPQKLSWVPPMKVPVVDIVSAEAANTNTPTVADALQAAETSSVAEVAVAAPAAERATDDSAAVWMADWSRVWTHAARTLIDATTAMTDQSLATLSAATKAAASMSTPPKAPAPELNLWARPSRPRSWYRPPATNFFDPTVWGFPAPLAVFGVPVSASMFPMLPNMMPSYMGNAMAWNSGWPTPFGTGFTSPSLMDAFCPQPANPMTAWMDSFKPKPPASPWAKMTDAMTNAMTSQPYSSYRSDSGHAVAQIVRREPKAEAKPDPMAIWNLFGWPTTKH